MILVEEGRIKLDDPLYRYAPQFRCVLKCQSPSTHPIPT
jgi:CubicO group peptidase (beta-lactamase class C family)